ncbi:hypothetical protein N7471_006835 [Penicillium samsonianum]|uniref:uncharacterized protein n=1 Tax=Penicillium samsonianum TaxID=1882272 RepID=UPI0025478CB8|nr:uncharacterized protein N7471_006835 [Penicillium samsonianum]KAJ6140349.1 hypothetical protein N7471_006835 [Penicillium samsonianum]
MQFVRKAEEALTGKKDESHESTKSSNHGPHSSNLANKLDPRVDSDRDNRAAHTDVTGAGPGTTHGSTAATGTHSSTLGSGTTHGHTTSTNAGPHSSNITNKADPRVDSDRDNRARHEGLTGAGTGAGLGSTHNTPATTTHGSALGSGTGATHGTSAVTGTGAGLGSTHGTTHSSNVGPHSSKIANKADPRVDSDRDNRARHEGLAGAGTGTGLGSTHNTAATGTHGSTLGSGTTHGTSGITGAGAGLGSTHNTAATGTHGSTLGSGTTHGTSGITGTGASLGSTHNTAATGTHGSTLGSGTTHGTSGVTGTGAGLGSTHGSTLGSGTGAPHSTPIVTPGSSSTNAGPHSSDIANKLDPRVDSDRDSHAQPRSPLASTGAGTTTHGTHTRDATAAPTGSAIGRSGLDSAGHRDALAGSSYNTPATGTASGATGTTGTTGTTGPHGSSIANKLDPRVDSDATRAQNEGLHRQI